MFYKTAIKHFPTRPTKAPEKHHPQSSNNPFHQSLGPPPVPVSNGQPMMYTTGPYSDPNYLQMAIGAYLTPSANGYKCVDPYFLSQGNQTREAV